MPAIAQGASARAPARPRASTVVAQEMEQSVARIRSLEARAKTSREDLAEAVDSDAPDERVMALQLGLDTLEGTLANLRNRHAELEREFGEARAAEALRGKHETMASLARRAHEAHEAARAQRAALHEACRRLVPEIMAAEAREAEARQAFRDQLRELVPGAFRSLYRTSPAEDAAIRAELEAVLQALAAEGVPLEAVRATTGFQRIEGLDQDRRELPLVPFGAAIEMAVRLGVEANAGRPLNIPGLVPGLPL